MIKEANRLSFIKEYYFSRKLREVAGMIAEGKPVLNLGIGNPDMMPSTETIEALKMSATGEKNHGYQPYKGIPELREAMSQWYRSTYDVYLDPEKEILPLIGSKEGINHIAQAFINPDDVALVPNPGYPAYASAVRMAEGTPVSYDLNENDGWAPEWEQLKPSLLKQTKVWFVNYPNMPTGSTGSHEVFARILDLARTFDILVVNDNPYSLILNQDVPMSIHQLEGSREVALELNSLSKSHNMAGWRIGMLMGREEYLQPVLKVKSNIDSGMFRPLQEAAIHALDNSEAWHAERNEVYAGRRRLASAILNELNCVYDHGQVGMFLWAKIPDRYSDAEELTEKILYEAHVFLTPGFVFGNNGKRYIRISLCSQESILSRALERIKQLEL
ncbi:MAG: aminotransferase class I/II-fold pyridoxal phosphate-dependent enzyme [Bacteroidetes bacterium]|nr:aminotransferase class I/II-fold pyridoxal phosphate-dependent enzyme [Bacteroidota bacterium]